MKNVNKVILVGHVGGDPVLRETKTGLKVARFSVATSYGAEPTQTQWHKIVAWGNQADACATYLKKGHMVYVEGALKSNRYTGEDQVTRVFFEVHAQDVSFLTPKNRAGAIESEALEVGDLESVDSSDHAEMEEIAL